MMRPDVSLGQRPTCLVDDLYIVARERSPAADDANGVAGCDGGRRYRPGLANEPTRIDRVDLDAVARKRHRQRVLGKAVAWHEARRTEAGDGEARRRKPRACRSESARRRSPPRASSKDPAMQSVRASPVRRHSSYAKFGANETVPR